MHCVDLGESFQTHIYLQNLASIQPRTSSLKFAVRAAAEPRRLAGGALSLAPPRSREGEIVAAFGSEHALRLLVLASPKDKKGVFCKNTILKSVHMCTHKEDTY